MRGSKLGQKLLENRSLFLGVILPYSEYGRPAMTGIESRRPVPGTPNDFPLFARLSAARSTSGEDMSVYVWRTQLWVLRLGNPANARRWLHIKRPDNIRDRESSKNWRHTFKLSAECGNFVSVYSRACACSLLLTVPIIVRLPELTERMYLIAMEAVVVPKTAAARGLATRHCRSRTFPHKESLL